MITNVYIDGFNLYYRALKDTAFRWLDLWHLAETLFPQDTVNRSATLPRSLTPVRTTPFNPAKNWYI